MDNLPVCKEWLDYANTDYQSAKFLTQMYPVPIEVICYHCEQAVEKLLKAFLIYKEQDTPKTHDLVYLNELCSKLDSSFDSISDICFDLTPYGVQVRYPSHMDLSEIDMQTALAGCSEALIFVTPKLNLLVM